MTYYCIATKLTIIILNPRKNIYLNYNPKELKDNSISVISICVLTWLKQLHYIYEPLINRPFLSLQLPM